MEAVAYSTFRKDLRAYLDKTRDDATPLLVTSKDPSANVVVMNAMDYDNLIENLEVQSNARLMGKIERGMKQFAEERGAKRRNTSIYPGSATKFCGQNTVVRCAESAF